MVDRQEVENLLRAAGPAHHEAFNGTDGDDPEWPLWYAGHLQEGLSDALGVTLTKSELVYQLVDLDHEHRSKDPESEWPSFYAQALVDRTEAGDLS
ncbi:MAG: hypothetical protein OEM22_00400 [Acidimicrobiia bacterium]|nr:hypothetical protein [Acidimicrobiia bacterium]MDH3470751.1 hypothetical protein [Acidimicrobiia bacterium]